MIRTAPFAPTVVVMTVAGLLVVGQMYVVIPLLPDMAAEWGTTPAAATWTATGFGLAYAGGFLLTGPLSDRFGRRAVITAGLVVMAIATCAVPLMPTLGTGVAMRAVQGLGAAGFSPPALAYLSERIEPRRRPVALTCLITAMVAAAVVGQLGGQAVAALVGWRGVFLVSAVAVAGLIVVLRLVLVPDETAGATRLVDPFLAMGRLLRRPELLLVYVAALAVLGAFVAVYTALQLIGPPELTTNPQAMLWLRASALPALVAIPFLAPVLDRIRPTVRGAGAMVLAAGALVVLTLASSSVVVISLLMLVFVGALTAISPGLTELISSLAGPARGAANALYTFALLMGASLGPQVVTATRGGGLTAVLWVVAGALLAGAGLLLCAARLLHGTRGAVASSAGLSGRAG